MNPFSRSLLIFTIIIIFVLSFPPTAESHPHDPSLIQLPTTDENSAGDLCAGTPTPTTCPVNCFRTDPVCGADGVTYWCGCADAHCAGTPVAKLGFCEVGNGGSGSLSGQALLLVHILWLILLGFSVLFGFL